MYCTLNARGMLFKAHMMTRNDVTRTQPPLVVAAVSIGMTFTTTPKMLATHVVVYICNKGHRAERQLLRWSTATHSLPPHSARGDMLGNSLYRAGGDIKN